MSDRQNDGENLDQIYTALRRTSTELILDRHVGEPLRKLQDEVWKSVLERIQADTEADVSGEPDEGSEVFIGFDVIGDTLSYAVVSGDCIWRTGSFPVPDDADEEDRSRMGQVVIKGRWTTQSTDARSTT